MRPHRAGAVHSRRPGTTKPGLRGERIEPEVITMKRDMELVRQILFEVEKKEDPIEPLDPKIDGKSELEISYHVMLASDAGLIKALDRTAIGVFRWSASFLTWDGHEFLDAARDEALWKEAKSMAENAAEAVAFDVLKKTLLELSEQRIKSKAAAKSA